MPDIAIVGFIAGCILFFLLGFGSALFAIALAKAATRADEIEEQQCECHRRETENDLQEAS